MLFARSASLRDLALVCGALAVISAPMACAHGYAEPDLGVGGATGAGGQTVGHPTTVTVTSSATTTSTTGFPSASVTSTTATTTTSGFPTASSTTSGFPTSNGTTVGPGPSSSVSTGTGSSSCDVGIDCGSCSQCADGSVCLLQSFDCQFDPDCSTILCCAANCLDNACVDACIAADPAGQQLFIDYVNCLACSCQNACQIPAGSCP
jgi:hypothetical protein